MIIEFSASNFRSIRLRCTLSLVAGRRDASLPENLIDPEIPGLADTRLVRTAAIYGANASGKTNLYRAAEFMQGFVTDSATGLKHGDETGVVPFRLDPQAEGEPSEFEVIFITGGVRYQYGITTDSRRVHEEWLTAYPMGKPQRWFERRLHKESGRYDWTFGQKLRGDRQSLADKTRENVLFLSVAAQFNHEQLTSVYEWFKDDLRLLDLSFGSLQPTFTAKLLLEREDLKERLQRLARHADLGIAAVCAELVSVEDSSVLAKMLADLPEQERSRVTAELKDKKLFDLFWLHDKGGTTDKVRFSEEDESAGTRKFTALLGPWVDTLEHGYTVFVDEIGANMHPMLVRELVRMIHNPDLNRHNAQLILTTHDTTLLDTSLFRRDQIWFTEKDTTGDTVLYPLTDYKPRKDEALQKGYLAGRYGAIPFLGDFSF
jgi:uncharacterized protein